MSEEPSVSQSNQPNQLDKPNKPNKPTPLQLRERYGLNIADLAHKAKVAQRRL